MAKPPRSKPATKKSKPPAKRPAASARKPAPAAKKAKPAARQPEPSPSTANATRAAPALRGIALVDQVIEAVRAKRADFEVFEPRPIDPAVLATATFPNGSPLPPSLKRWLAFDASWLIREYPQFAAPSGVAARLKHWRELIDGAIGGGMWGRYFAGLAGTPLDGAGIELDIGSDSMRALFVGKPDEHGEYPVVWADVDDTPELGIEWPGFDVWLASCAGLVDSPRLYAADIAAHARLNFGGATTVELRGGWVGSDGDATLWSGPELDAHGDEPPAPAPFPDAVPLPITTTAVTTPVPRMALARLCGALVEAIEGGDTDDIERLLAAGVAQYPGRREWLDPALAAAAAGEELPHIDRLLALGASPDAPASFGWTVLGSAARAGHVAVVERLLAAGASTEIHQGVAGETALGDAADQLQLDCVRALLARGANPGAPNEDGLAPLHRAARYFEGARANMLPIATALLDAGAQIDARDKAGRTPLAWAIDPTGSFDVARLLIERGADVDIQNAFGESAALLAWKHRKHAVLSAILARGPAWDVRDRDGVQLDDVLDPDGTSPRELEVALVCQEAAQDVELEVEWLCWDKRSDAATSVPRSLSSAVEQAMRLIALGAAGDATFAPGRGVGEVVEAPGNPAGAKVQHRYRMRWKLRIGGAAPAAIARMAANIALPIPLDVRARALRIVGSVPLDDSPHAIDTARFKPLFAARPSPVAWPSAGFAIHRAPGKDLAATIDLVDRAQTTAFGTSLRRQFETALTTLPPAPGAPVSGPVLVDCKPGKTGLDVRIRSLVPDTQPSFDRDAAFAILSNLLAGAHARGTQIARATLQL